MIFANSYLRNALFAVLLDYGRVRPVSSFTTLTHDLLVYAFRAWHDVLKPQHTLSRAASAVSRRHRTVKCVPVPFGQFYPGLRWSALQFIVGVSACCSVDCSAVCCISCTNDCDSNKRSWLKCTCLRWHFVRVNEMTTKWTELECSFWGMGADIKKCSLFNVLRVLETDLETASREFCLTDCDVWKHFWSVQWVWLAAPSLQWESDQ